MSGHLGFLAMKRNETKQKQDERGQIAILVEESRMVVVAVSTSLR